MTSVKQLTTQAQRAYWACSHVEQEWLANELEADLGPIQDALGAIMYPEQFATSWEKELYEVLDIIVTSAIDMGLDLGEDGKPDEVFKRANKVLRQFSKEQENRLEARIQMEAYSHTH